MQESLLQVAEAFHAARQAETGAGAAAQEETAEEVKAETASDPQPQPTPDDDDLNGEIPADAKSETATDTAKPDTQTQDSKAPDRLSKSWAAISKREAQVRAQQKYLAEQRQLIEQQREELDKAKSWRDSLQRDPVAFMDQNVGPGWYQKATERFLQDSSGKQPVEERVTYLQQQLEKERTERDKWFEEQWQKRSAKQQEAVQYEQRANKYMEQVNELISKDERFELTRGTKGASDAVIELVNGYLQQHQRLLTPEEAITLIEQELESQAETMFKVPKLRTKLGLTTPESNSKTQQAKSGPSKTLTNKLSASGTPAHTPKKEDRIAEAAKLFRQMRAQERES